MIEILPFVALERILFYDGHEAVKRLLTIRPDYRKSLDFSSMHACMLMTYLVDFLNAQDPLKQSTVYKTLERVDKGFKNQTPFDLLYLEIQSREISFSLSASDYLLGWAQTKVIPRLDAIPKLIADEAVYIIQHKSRYFDYYKLFPKQNASFEELWLRIEKDEKLELKTLADEQRKLKAQIDAQAGPRSHSKHKNKKGSFTASSMFRGF
ncbi:hypothetical protein BFJ69_g6856 [Fusarium oxysporum]|uniref:Uncharacterized protein n=1 Tax=Fusarium oxysporum TaxID=5507 RepID=A0A420N8W4_FUSOX|nr:hypothetical protein BFJ69_g6856 [Fusarium oxysporum]